MKKIGIYGGTFDPIHHAHLILAGDALEKLQLDRVIFVPAALSPHKLDRTPTVAAVRLEMLGVTLAGAPGFALDDCELQRPAPSFAIDTMEMFTRSNEGVEFYYLIGSDNVPRLQTWHRFEELRKLVKFVVLERGTISSDTGYLTIHRQIDISSTQIRNRVASGRSIRYLVPPPVEEIIRRRQLYTEPNRSPQKS